MKLSKYILSAVTLCIIAFPSFAEKVFNPKKTNVTVVHNMVFDTNTQMLYGSVNADTDPEFMDQLSGVASLKAADFVL